MNRIAAALLVVCMTACRQSGDTHGASAGDISVPVLDQGWTQADRGVFYTTGQGSRLMPYAWFAALRRPGSTERFAADKLARYGYLAAAGDAALPVGFVVDPASGDLGMTCAACHTGQLRYKGQTWRIDGGRASADFQAFLTDLTASARATAASPDALNALSAEVAGPQAAPGDVQSVSKGFTDWTAGFGGFMDHSLPRPGWGPGRLDAFGMIFNRVAGLDLRIDANYRPADAPVRYPFLWNAPFQDRTQWDGAAPNGSFLKAMARNTGEVFGVFGHFDPDVIGPHVVLYANSVNFRNLQTLETEIARLKPPPWPKAAFGLDDTLAAAGAKVWQGNCAACHAQRPSQSVHGAWATPVCRVGTDPLMYTNALLSARSGRLGGTLQIADNGLLSDPAKKVSILANAVIGSLILNAGTVDSGIWRAINADAQAALNPDRFGATAPGTGADLPPECRDAVGAPAPASENSSSTGPAAKIADATHGLYVMPSTGVAAASAPSPAAYEARVLAGIWATAPYLHNGSVPTLAELLKPAGERVRVVPQASWDFDPVAIGIAAASAPQGQTPITTDQPGNSNAGHDYGTTLSPTDKQALLEYLKTI